VVLPSGDVDDVYAFLIIAGCFAVIFGLRWGLERI
jgi:hypothetical protein